MNKQEIEKTAFNISAPKVKNIIGEKYGRLTVIEQHTNANKHRPNCKSWKQRQLS